MTTGTLGTQKMPNNFSSTGGSTIWNRYEVLDHSGKPVMNETFVLHLDDPYAKPALLAYARAIQNDAPEVATQIWERFPDAATSLK